MLGSSSPANSGVYGLLEDAGGDDDVVGLEALGRRRSRRSGRLSFVSASTAAPLRTGSSKRVAYASR